MRFLIISIMLLVICVLYSGSRVYSGQLQKIYYNNDTPIEAPGIAGHREQ